MIKKFAVILAAVILSGIFGINVAAQLQGSPQTTVKLRSAIQHPLGLNLLRYN